MPSFNFPTVVAGVVLVLVAAGFALERLDLVSADVLRLMPAAIALVIGGAMAYAAFGRKRPPPARKKPTAPKRHGKS
jgi:pyrroline-5-carboxylate reductase